MNVRRTCLIAISSAVLGVALVGPGHPAQANSPPAAGQLVSFGDDTYGQLGQGQASSTFRPVPHLVSLPSGAGSIASVAESGEDGFAISATGKLYGWGDNERGQLGQPPGGDSDGSTPVTIPIPISIPATYGLPKQVAASDNFIIVLTTGGKLYGIGANESQVFGPGSGVTSTPVLIAFDADHLGKPVQISVSEGVVLVRTDEGRAVSFGNNYYGQLGYDGYATGGNPTPTAIPGLTGVTQVSAGEGHSLVLAGGVVYAFGENNSGQLGLDPKTVQQQSKPNPVTLAPNVTATQIAAGDTDSVVLGSDNNVYGFGNAYNGQLGVASPASGYAVTPVTAVLPSNQVGPIVGLTNTGYDTFAVTNSGQLMGWGLDSTGGLGYTNTSGLIAPPEVLANIGNTSELAASSSNAASTLVVISGLKSTGGLIEGQVGVDYQATLHGTGGAGPYLFSADVPDGLTAGGYGDVSGKPTTAGTSTVTVVVIDANLIEASQQFTLTIDPAAAAPPTSTSSAPTATSPTPPAFGPTEPAPLVPIPVPAGPSNSSIIAALVAGLVPQHKSAAFATLAKHGYSQSVTVLESGKLTITWSYQPPRAHGAKQATKPVTVATGSATFTKTGGSHVTVKLTRAGAKLLKLGHRVGITFDAAFTHSNQKLTGHRTAKLS